MALYYEEIGKNHEKITKIKPFINKYKRERKNFQQKEMIKKYLKKNVRITLNVLYAKKENTSCL